MHGWTDITPITYVSLTCMHVNIIAILQLKLSSEPVAERVLPSAIRLPHVAGRYLHSCRAFFPSHVRDGRPLIGCKLPSLRRAAWSCRSLGRDPLLHRLSMVAADQAPSSQSHLPRREGQEKLGIRINHSSHTYPALYGAPHRRPPLCKKAPILISPLSIWWG